MKIIGIDPGLSGAIAILENNKVLNIFEIPVMSEGKKNKRQLNSAQLVKLLKDNISEKDEVFGVLLITMQGMPSLLSHSQFFSSSASKFKFEKINKITMNNNFFLHI